MIEVDGLTKEFSPLLAVSQLSFSVGKGEVLGLLGPNGAGKSTTMKMLMGHLQPTSGQARICGYSVADEVIKLRQHVGYMPENAPLYEDMTVEEFLKFVADIREMPLEKRAKAIDMVVEKCSIADVYARPISVLSKGYKRRVSFAQAILHDPEVLILDEPTDGLDPNQKFDVRKLIKNLSQEKCIILSTHILEEVEAVCTRAIIISQGRKIFDGTPDQLRRKSRDQKVDDVFRAMTTGDAIEGVTL